MGAEIYGNRFTVVDSDHTKASAVVVHRGGRAAVFFNKVSGSSPELVGSYEVREEATDADQATAHRCPSTRMHLYPGTYSCAPDGQPQHISASFYWNNRTNGVLRIPFIRKQPNWINGLVENVHFWRQNPLYNGATERGVYCGAALPKHCVPGDGAWIGSLSCDTVSDANTGRNPLSPISGVFYRCTVADTWTEHFRPYPYPHPLASEILCQHD